ncbi:hypothetical protein POTOM_014172 [Populus tomentosa]|uniref:MOSC domain-containing protein n=1 Tax=Populus tomentosa TaxID=118781 RepID=A0A8X8CZ45_POPTO|nr:hypothetical protein POTOM_014172 [Populus tomentosa]
MEATAKVSSIFIYPVKSCRGISLSQAPLTPTGFRWDRNWLVVNNRGRAYTQRVEPKLALVEIELPDEAFSEGWEPTKNSFMKIKAPGMSVLKISLMKPSEVAEGVSVWEWSGSALDEGAEAAKWFSDYLGKPSKLGSLDALNQLLREPVPINRFRPNILVEGCEPFSEDLWTEIRISKFTFEGVKLCSRCKIPTINQDTGIGGTEPNETLKKIRSDRVLRPDTKPQGKIYFGQNLVWKENPGEGHGKIVNVGDPVSVLKKVSSVAEAAA